MIQKQLRDCMSSQGQGFPFSHGRSRRCFKVVAAVELGLKTGSEWAEKGFGWSRILLSER